MKHRWANWALPSEVLLLQRFGQKVLHFRWENQAVCHLLAGNWSSKTKLPVSPFQLFQNSHLILWQSSYSNGKNVPWSEDRACLCPCPCSSHHVSSFFVLLLKVSSSFRQNIISKNITMPILYIILLKIIFKLICLSGCKHFLIITWSKNQKIFQYNCIFCLFPGNQAI